jgi:hypothetical protein
LGLRFKSLITSNPIFINQISSYFATVTFGLVGALVVFTGALAAVLAGVLGLAAAFGLAGAFLAGATIDEAFVSAGSASTLGASTLTGSSIGADASTL